MRRFIIFASVFSLLAAPALAQTLLSISATGQAQSPPDEASAQLTAQATAPDAASAQAAVNQAMAAALAQARQLPGITATTGGYNSYASTPDNSTRPQFTAQQTLQLTMPAAGGIPPDDFSALLGRLQASGLLLNGLEGDLSTQGQAKAERAAIADALAQLKTQAADIAANLGETAGSITTLNVNTDAMPPGPRPMMRMAAMAAPAPQSAPDNITTTASVTAQIQLLAR